jgi:hypothetical protein
MQTIISVFRKIVFGILLWAHAGEEYYEHIRREAKIDSELVGIEFPIETKLHKYGTGHFDRNNRILKPYDTKGIALCSGLGKNLPTTDCAAGDLFDTPEGVFALVGHKAVSSTLYGSESVPLGLDPVFEEANAYIKKRRSYITRTGISRRIHN